MRIKNCNYYYYYIDTYEIRVKYQGGFLHFNPNC